MKELDNIIKQLKETLEKKEKELLSQDGFNSYTQGHLNNRRNDIKGLELSIINISKGTLVSAAIIKEFKLTAQRIFKEIEDIKD